MIIAGTGSIYIYYEGDMRAVEANRKLDKSENEGKDILFFRICLEINIMLIIAEKI